MRVGVLGLGRMGAPIARTLAGQHEVLGFDPVLRPGDPVALASSVEVLVTVLPGSAELDSLPPVLAALRPGSLWLDLTSGDPRVVRRLASATQDILVVGAPMAGGPAAAEAQALSFHLGGAPAEIGRAHV